jgi:hypothetical protein
MSPPESRQYLLKLLAVPEGVTGAPPAGTVWELPVQGLFTLALPTYRTTNGLEGYRFAFTISDALAVPGDAYDDYIVDLHDYAVFADCMAGPDVPPDPRLTTNRACLGRFDYDADSDVDGRDFARFQVLCGAR